MIATVHHATYHVGCGPFIVCAALLLFLAWAVITPDSTVGPTFSSRAPQTRPRVTGGPVGSSVEKRPVPQNCSLRSGPGAPRRLDRRPEPQSRSAR